MDTQFVGFPKIPRLSREIVITEKIDGTCGQIFWDETGTFMLVGSKGRWITTSDDNYGFARWASDNVEELKKLGPGRHLGEWWGQGIQRNYGLKEKRFSLFNTTRWDQKMFNKFKIEPWERGDRKDLRPEFVTPPDCCHVVPVLTWGEFHSDLVTATMKCLEEHGSYAAPGFMNPEGIVIWHSAGNLLFKKTIKDDQKYKGDTT